MREPATQSSSNMGEPRSKRISHMEIRRSDNGGHVLTTHHQNFNHPPVVHTFAKGEGGMAHKHIEKTMGMKLDAPYDEGYGKEESPEEENAKAD